MNETRLVKISKYLSKRLKHLRHDPEGLGLTLAPVGWVGVDDLLAACARRRFGLSRAELEEAAAQNSKQRFSFGPSGTLIRANQGHSVEVDLQLSPAVPPEFLHLPATQQMLSLMRRVMAGNDPGELFAGHHLLSFWRDKTISTSSQTCVQGLE